MNLANLVEFTVPSREKTHFQEIASAGRD